MLVKYQDISINLFNFFNSDGLIITCLKQSHGFTKICYKGWFLHSSFRLSVSKKILKTGLEYFADNH